MTDLLRVLGTALFGWRWIRLGFNDEMEIRRVCWRGGRPFAYAYRSLNKRAWLDDGGATSGGPIYCKRWEPYDPNPFAFRKRRWPVPPAETAA